MKPADSLGVGLYSLVEAARLDGASQMRVIFEHMLPAFYSHIIASITLSIPGTILAETSLSFLGLGVQPPSPDWGRMVNEARDSFAQTPWALWAPAGAIAILVIGVNLLSDGLRRVFRYEGQIE